MMTWLEHRIHNVYGRVQIVYVDRCRDKTESWLRSSLCIMKTIEELGKNLVRESHLTLDGQEDGAVEERVDIGSVVYLKHDDVHGKTHIKEDFYIMSENVIGRTGRGKAFRRHHMHRLKKKRVAWYGDVRNYHTPKMCSCPMCGNPRRHFGELTRQERRQNDR